MLVRRRPTSRAARDLAGIGGEPLRVDRLIAPARSGYTSIPSAGPRCSDTPRRQRSPRARPHGIRTCVDSFGLCIARTSAPMSKESPPTVRMTGRVPRLGGVAGTRSPPPTETQVHEPRENVRSTRYSFTRIRARHRPRRQRASTPPRSIQREHAVRRVGPRDQQEDGRVVPPLPSSELLPGPHAEVVRRADPEDRDETRGVDGNGDASGCRRCQHQQDETGRHRHEERHPMDPATGQRRPPSPTTEGPRIRGCSLGTSTSRGRRALARTRRCRGRVRKRRRAEVRASRGALL